MTGIAWRARRPQRVRASPCDAGAFSQHLRAYWGQQAILVGAWQPPAIVRAGASDR